MDITGITVFNVLALAIIKKSSHGISHVLVLLMKMTELLCRTFIGTNLCPEWERFLVSNVGKYLELCDIEFNINYQDHCCSWNEAQFVLSLARLFFLSLICFVAYVRGIIISLNLSILVEGLPAETKLIGSTNL